MRVDILLPSRCWWWARFLLWSLFDVSKFFLWPSSILQSYIRCSDDRAPSLQGGGWVCM